MTLDPIRETWMSTPETSAVMDALTKDGGEARFVGGAVRNALIARPVADIDIATPLSPAEVTRRVKDAGLEAIPTGIDHGTVTAIAAGRPFEVTTLRRDVSTDGRRAKVAFTSDWKEDASRRDFTMNALYASRDGELFDYFEGVPDLREGRVRFVGDPVTRIREDYLRILRLFRFHAWYGRGTLDKNALEAATAERTGLRRLSGERVRKEMMRLLESHNPVYAVHAMAEGAILSEILPFYSNVSRFERLVSIETENSLESSALLRLAALMPETLDAVDTVSDRLKLSNGERAKLRETIAATQEITSVLSEADARKFIHRFGGEAVRYAIRLRWAEAGPASSPKWKGLSHTAQAWRPPPFPLSGRDVVAAGVPAGPRVGKILSELEDWWTARDFQPSEKALRERLIAVVQASE